MFARVFYRHCWHIANILSVIIIAVDIIMICLSLHAELWKFQQTQKTCPWYNQWGPSIVKFSISSGTTPLTVSKILFCTIDIFYPCPGHREPLFITLTLWLLLSVMEAHTTFPKIKYHELRCCVGSDISLAHQMRWWGAACHTVLALI